MATYINAVPTEAVKLWDIYEFTCTQSIVEFKPFRQCRLRLEVYGAQGGNGYKSWNQGGKGGFAYGEVQLNKDDVIYVVVGGRGKNASNGGSNSPSLPGGYNGGGVAGGSAGGGYWFETYWMCSGSGGGGSDIRLNGQGWANRIIVAGGGAGSFYHTNNGLNFLGGYGGGIVGGNGWYSNGSAIAGGTQSKGHALGIGQSGVKCTYNPWGSEGHPGAGGGYWGGYAITWNASWASGSAGGGSGYIGGVLNGRMEANRKAGDGFIRITIIPYAPSLFLLKDTEGVQLLNELLV